MAVRKHSVIMTAPVRRNEPLVLMVILLVAALLRLWGLGSGAPGRYQPQEQSFVNAALSLLAGEFIPTSFTHPPLFSYFVAFLLKGVELLGQLTAIDGLIAAAKPVVPLDGFTVQLIGRAVSCVFGVAGVFATYLLGRIAYGEVTGLIAAALLAINFSHVRESHFATPATTFLFFLLLALVYALKIADRGERRSYALFGAFAAVSVTGSYSGILLIAPFLLAHLSFSFRKGNMTLPTDQAKSILITGGAALAVFLVLNLGFVLQWERALKELSLYTTSVPLLGRNESGGWERLGPVALGFGAGIWLSALAAAGFLFVLGEAAFVGRRKVAGLVLAAYPVAWGSLLLANGAVNPQLVSSAMPLLLLLAVRVTWAVAERFLSNALATSLTVALLFAAAVEPLIRTLQMDQLLAHPDTRTLAQQWMIEHLPVGAQVAVRQRSLYARPELFERFPTVELERLVALETLRAKHETFYAIVDEFPPLPQLCPAVPGWLQRFLAEHGKIVASFDPRNSVEGSAWNGAVYDGAEGNFLPVAGFDAIAHAGPLLTIYSVAGEAKETP